jgi:uncharacterized protein DUF4253
MCWRPGGGEGGDDEDHAVLAEARAPFGRRFPGLAPPSDSCLGPAEMEQAIVSLELATVLRSWEERFGARLLRIGSDAKLKVLVERPPRTLEDAWPIAAEHWAFADECGGAGLRDIAAIAASLVNAPIWTFWWD